MTPRPASALLSELLYDSEAALRLVDSAIEDIREPDARLAAQAGAEGTGAARARQLEDALSARGSLGLLALSQSLARGYAEILSVLSSLRESRNVLEQATAGKIQQTHAKLREVTNATEVAATDILNGLERALALVDRMDASAAGGDVSGAPELRNALRDELFALMSCMQFQDITTQQINYASSILIEMENRLAELASVLDPTAFGTVRVASPTPEPNARPVSFDPAASTENADARQAVADEIFRRDSR